MWDLSPLTAACEHVCTHMVGVHMCACVCMLGGGCVHPCKGVCTSVCAHDAVCVCCRLCPHMCVHAHVCARLGLCVCMGGGGSYMYQVCAGLSDCVEGWACERAQCPLCPCMHTACAMGLPVSLCTRVGACGGARTLPVPRDPMMALCHGSWLSLGVPFPCPWRNLGGAMRAPPPRPSHCPGSQA